MVNLYCKEEYNIIYKNNIQNIKEIMHENKIIEYFHGFSCDFVCFVKISM
jgi:hypothetical protein